MSKGQTEAEKLLNELRIIPKMINEIERDIVANKSSLLSSPQWSDMKVDGGIRKSQEDKNVAIIYKNEQNYKRIEELQKRKDWIVSMIMQVPDMIYSHILYTTYVTCETNDEAMDRLYLGRTKYHTIKRKASEEFWRICEQKRTNANKDG